jgi:hypothetical protein
MKKLVGHGFASESRIPPSVETSAIPTLSSRGRGDHERQHEQDADHLDRLGSGQREQQEDRDRERPERDSARRRDLRVDAREEERPVEHREPCEDDGANDREVSQLRIRDADDAAEEQACRLGCVALVEREEEHADPEPEGEYSSDRAVPFAASQREEPEHEPDEQRAAEDAEHRVDPDHERARGAGEAELRDRVHREAHPARDDEDADRSGHDRGDRAGPERGMHEGLAEQLHEHQCACSPT